MATSTIVPLTIDPEAATLIACLGLERPFGEMIEHARRAVATLRRIEVECGTRVDDPDNPTIIIYLIVELSGRPMDLDERIRDELVRWFLRTYPPEVARHFLLEVLGDRS